MKAYLCKTSSIDDGEEMELNTIEDLLDLIHDAHEKYRATEVVVAHEVGDERIYLEIVDDYRE